MDTQYDQLREPGRHLDPGSFAGFFLPCNVKRQLAKEGVFLFESTPWYPPVWLAEGKATNFRAQKRHPTNWSEALAFVGICVNSAEFAENSKIFGTAQMASASAPEKPQHRLQVRATADSDGKQMRALVSLSVVLVEKLMALVHLVV